MMKRKSEQGIALLWVVFAGLLLITGVGLAFPKQQAKRVKVNQEVSQPEEIKKEVGEKEEEFVGQIKDIIAKGMPMKCTYTQEGFTGVSFIKGKKMYSEISGGGKSGYTIIKDNCMWNWGWGAEQGTKMCFGGDILAMPETIPAGIEHQCVLFSFPDSRFDPPADINFIATGETAPLSDEDLLKILPPKERSDLESAIRETQEVLKNIEVFTPPTIDNIREGLKGLDQINQQTRGQIQQNIQRQRQQFQPPDVNKMIEELKQHPPAVPYEGEKEPSLEEQEYYYRKYILKDPSVQY